MGLRRTTAAAIAVASIAAVSLSSTVAAGPAAAADPGPTSYSGPGPYAVGERTMQLRSGASVEVWYPARKVDVRGKRIGTYDVADWLPSFLVPEGGVSVTHPSGGVRRVPVAHQRFPLVVFSHGYAGFRTQSSALTAALASWGFIVAAPDHHSRSLTQALLGPRGTTTDVADLRATITLIRDKSAKKRNWLHRHVDLSHVGALGHSAGGRAVENLAAVDRRVDTFIGMAGASAGALDEGARVPDEPGLILAATDDGIVGLDRLEQAYDAMAEPKQIVHIGGAGHLVFSDLCSIGDADGGLLTLAEAVGITVPANLVPLATDGCLEPALEPELAWPAITHVIVAHLRHVFRLDASDSALTGLEEAYPGIVTGGRSAPGRTS